MAVGMSIVKRVATNWPFTNGSGRFVDTFARGFDLGDDERVCRTSDGFDISVIGNDLIGRHIFFSGKFDRSIAETLQLFSEPGDVILDIGANVGYVSCVLLQTIPDSTIYCVEPQPNIAHLLRKNLSRFGQDRGHVLEAALSDENGSVTMALTPGNFGASTIRSGNSDGVLTVKCLHAGEYLSQFSKIDLIKVDVEGHEAVLFAAAEQELQRLKPKAIVLECHGSDAGPSGAVGKSLGRSGYDLYGIQKTLLRTTLMPIKSDSDCHFNDYVALSRHRQLPATDKLRFR